MTNIAMAAYRFLLIRRTDGRYASFGVQAEKQRRVLLRNRDNWNVFVSNLIYYVFDFATLQILFFKTIFFI